MSDTNILRILVFTGAALYFIYHAIKRREIHDERQQLIEARATRYLSSYAAFTVAGFGMAYLWFPKMDAIYLIVTLALGWMVVEPGARLVLQRRM